MSDEPPPKPLPPSLQKLSEKVSHGLAMLILGVGIATLMLTCVGSTYNTLQRSRYGALQLVANDGDVVKLKQLLQSGADVNAQCEFRNWTALHAAADRGQVAAARILLEHGAQVDLKDDSGYTPLHVTGSQPNGKGQPKSTEAGRNEIAVPLLDHGANPNATTNHGNNALHCAVGSYDAVLVKILLERGADPHHRDSEGYTPRDIAGFRNDQAAIDSFNTVRPATRRA